MPRSGLSNANGRSVQQISNILHGHGSFGATVARELEKYRDLPHGMLDGQTDSEFLDVPRVNVSVAAGHGSQPHIEDVIGHLKFARTFLRNCGVSPGSARVVDVRGNSMEPTIKDGALLLVSTSNRDPVDYTSLHWHAPAKG